MEEHSGSVDVILDYLQKKGFSRAEAALRSEMSSRPDINGFLKLSLNVKDAAAGVKEVVEEQKNVEKPDDEEIAGQPDDEDAAQADEDIETAAEAEELVFEMGGAGTYSTGMPAGGASSSRAPRRRRTYTMDQLADDMYQMLTSQRRMETSQRRMETHQKRIEDALAEQDRRHSVLEGMCGDMYRQMFGHFYDPNNLRFPRDPPPQFE